MKCLILAMVLSLALGMVIVLAGQDLPRANHESLEGDESHTYLVFQR